MAVSDLQTPIPPSYHIWVGKGLCHVAFNGRILGSEMVEAAAAMVEMCEDLDSPDVVWDCSAVSAHIIAPEEFAELGRIVLDNAWGHHAIVYSRAQDEDIISDLFRRFLESKGESASTHLSIDGALLELGRDAVSP